MAEIILTAIIVIAVLFYAHFTKYNNYWKKKNIVGPEPTFFFGNIKDTVLKRKHLSLAFKEIYDMYPEEKVVGMLVTRTPELLVRDLDVAKSILIKDFDIFIDRGFEFSKTGLGVNLFNADGDTWRVLRSCFSPQFTSAKLKNMLHLMIERGDIFVDYLNQITPSYPEQEVHELVQKFTQSTIAACAFGLDIDTFTKPHEALSDIDKQIFTFHLGHTLDMLYPGILKTIGGYFRKDIAAFFLKLTKDVIAQRNGEPSNRNDFMDLILALRKNKYIFGPKRGNVDIIKKVEVNDELIAAQAFVFYAGGYESSASTVAYLLYQLALNPKIQDKVVAEIEQVLEKYDGELTFQAILDLTYMGQVFDETLRMYPILSDLKRKSNSTYKIPNTNITLEKDQLIKISVLGIHSDPKIYPNPEVFDPERFSREHVAARHPCAYMPFGLGPRHCIGMRFARVQSQVCVAKLLRAFRVEPCARTPRRLRYRPTRLALKPDTGLPLNFVKRN